MEIIVWSGGQSGVDTGALFAARAVGFVTGGYAPAGWKTEVGPAPWMAEYGLVELPGAGYKTRTLQNVHESGAVLLIGGAGSPGSRLTAQAARENGRPFFHVGNPWDANASQAASWVIGAAVLTASKSGRPLRLLVAGNRESVWCGIQKQSQAFLEEVFQLVKEVKE